MSRTAVSVVLLLVLGPSPCRAYKPAEPERHDVRSPNGAFVLDVNPSTQQHTVYAAEDRKRPLWSFSARVGFGSFFLSNDGNVVARLAWKHVPIDGLAGSECISFRNRAGLVRTYTFGELCPDPRRRGWFEIGPVGSFWRVWYSSARQDGDELHVATTDVHEYTFSMTDGTIRAERLVAGNVLRRYWPLLALSVVLAVVAVLVVRRTRRLRTPPDGAESPAVPGAA